MFKLKPNHGADSYKLGHVDQYVDGTELVYANLTARNIKHLRCPDEYRTNKIVWAGPQAIIRDMMELWKEEFFDKNIDEIITNMAIRIKPFLNGNEFSFNKIRKLHAIGYLPLRIKSIKEGSRVNVGVPVMTIVNTNKEFAFLTNFIETYLSAEIWKIPTAATIADIFYRIITDFSNKTGGNVPFIRFQGHDFSYRGDSGSIDACKVGYGHMIPFLGGDTVPANDYVAYHYDGDKSAVGMTFSVPATEHSVMSMGSEENEVETFRRIMSVVYPRGIVSIVSDTWDYWDMMTRGIRELKHDILNRQTNELGQSKVVFRPDSGDPVKIITGYKAKGVVNEADLKSKAKSFYRRGIQAAGIDDTWYEIEYSVDSAGNVYNAVIGKELSLPEIKGSVICLEEVFGSTINTAGFNTLSQRVGLIYGDSIDTFKCKKILQNLLDKGYASDNIVFGLGSYTYQFNTRDTLGFAIKATYGEINGKAVEIFKNPKTDDGTKKSAKGLLRVEYINGNYVLFDQQTWEQESGGELQVIYEDGELYNFITLDEVRKNYQESVI